MGGGKSKFGVTYGSKAYKILKAEAKAKAKAQAAYGQAQTQDTKDTSNNNSRFVDFGGHHEALQKSTEFFKNPNNSNSEEWLQNLSKTEKGALQDYTGSAYSSINSALYKKNWEDIPNNLKSKITAIDSAMDKSVLLRGIQVTRQCDFRIFGAGAGEKMTPEQVKDFIKTHGENNVLENKGFLSFGANNHGASIAGWGLVIHANVPPSIGAGAYINPISYVSGSSENEYLFARNSNFKFDLNSIRMEGGKMHINATWVPGKKKKRK